MFCWLHLTSLSARHGLKPWFITVSAKCAHGEQHNNENQKVEAVRDETDNEETDDNDDNNSINQEILQLSESIDNDLDEVIETGGRH